MSRYETLKVGAVVTVNGIKGKVTEILPAADSYTLTPDSPGLADFNFTVGPTVVDPEPKLLDARGRFPHAARTSRQSLAQIGPYNSARAKAMREVQEMLDVIDDLTAWRREAEATIKRMRANESFKVAPNFTFNRPPDYDGTLNQRNWVEIFQEEFTGLSKIGRPDVTDGTVAP